MFLKANSFKDLLIHFFIMAVLFVAMVLCFFFLYLPVATEHGETITVPKLTGMDSKELESYLSDKDLRFQINDSSYTPGVKPLTVLTQNPLPGSQVKKNRKIYISVASINPPKVKMPKLVDGSLKSAEMTLKSYNLALGTIKYVPSPFSNLVIDQLIKGKTVQPGASIAKGTKIDLVVGNGTSTEDVQVPDLVGMSVNEAKTILESEGLMVGIEKPDPSSAFSPGTITRQKPTPGTTVKKGEMIDVWEARNPSDIIINK